MKIDTFKIQFYDHTQTANSFTLSYDTFRVSRFKRSTHIYIRNEFYRHINPPTVVNGFTFENFSSELSLIFFQHVTSLNLYEY